MSSLESLLFKFGPAEYFFFALLVLSCIGLATSASATKMLAAMAMGALLATVGVDVASGTARLTAGLDGLVEGLDRALVLIAFVLLPRTVASTVSSKAPVFLRGFPAGPMAWAHAVQAWRLALLVLAAVLFPLEWFYVETAGRTAVALSLLGMGLVCHRSGVPGVVLCCTFQAGWMLDENFRRMLLLSQGSLLQVVQRPLVPGFIVALVSVFAAHHVLLRTLARRREHRSRGAYPVGA